MSKYVRTFFWPVIAVLFVALLSTAAGMDLWDRHQENTEAELFYSKTLDATCLRTSYHAQAVMWCRPGDWLDDPGNGS